MSHTCDEDCHCGCDHCTAMRGHPNAHLYAPDMVKLTADLAAAHEALATVTAERDALRESHALATKWMKGIKAGAAAAARLAEQVELERDYLREWQQWACLELEGVEGNRMEPQPPAPATGGGDHGPPGKVE